MVGTKLQNKIIIYYEDFKCVKRPWAKFYTVILKYTYNFKKDTAELNK